MKLIYTNENCFLVGNIKNIVQRKGIHVVLKNEFLSGGSGDLAPHDTWLELWVVNDADYDQAMSIIQDFNDPIDREDWICSSCGEKNSSSFEFCWNCQNDDSNRGRQ